MNTDHKSILLDATVDDDHDNNTDDEEEEKYNVDGCMPLSRPFSQLSIFLGPPFRIFTHIVNSETGEIWSRNHAIPGTEMYFFLFLTKFTQPFTLTIRILPPLSVLWVSLTQVLQLSHLPSCAAAERFGAKQERILQEKY